jgi:hypothetical protein
MEGERNGRAAAAEARRRLARNLSRALALWLALSGIGLGIGITGYMVTEGMKPVDAFLNAAMILSGMGPIGALNTTPGKMFAGIYAIFSGLFLVVATGFVLAPIMHHVLHHFHVEQGKEDND